MGPASENLRLFVGIALPPEWREVLVKWRPSTPGVSWVRAENLHLTLHFLGNTPASQVPRLGAALQAACAQVPAFELRLGSPGAFPNARKARVIWVGLESPPALFGLVSELARVLEVSPAARPYTPHVTLGRRRQPAPLGPLDALPPSEPFRVTRVELLQSQLRPSGAVYTPLAEGLLK